MTRTGHQLIGLSGAIVLASLGLIIEAVGFFWGSTAPDALEISYKKPGMMGDRAWHYGRLISHRTLTHYWPLWGAALAGCVFLLPNYYFEFSALGYEFNVFYLMKLVLLGYIGGALGHILSDSATPMGVPLLTPYGKRFSFNLCRTGKAEWVFVFPIVVSSVFFAVSHVYINYII